MAIGSSRLILADPATLFKAIPKKIFSFDFCSVSLKYVYVFVPWITIYSLASIQRCN